MNNYKTLFCLRIFKSVIDTFIDTFFVLYFLDVSSDNIVSLGIYYIIFVSMVYVTIYACRNLARSRHRIRLLWVAMALDVLYFFVVILLQEKVAQYCYTLGFLRGLEEGFYYAVYNIMESDGINNRERAQFIGSYKAVKAALAVVFPIIFGGLMYTAGFVESSFVVIGIVVIRLILSLFYKDKNIPRGRKTNLKKFYEVTRGDRRFRRLNIMHFFDGLTCSTSAFSQVMTLYIVTVFSDSLSLGIFTAGFSVVSGLVGIVFAKFLKKKHYNLSIGTSGVAMIVTFLVMVFECTVVTIILFKFCRVVFIDLVHSINESSSANLSNDPKIKRDFKPEYWLNNERFLVAGRVLSNILFISMAFMSSWLPVMLIFAALLGTFVVTSIRFERLVLYRHRKPVRGRRLLAAFRFVEKGDLD